VGGRGIGRFARFMVVPCRPVKILWLAVAVWPPWGCNRENHDRHALGACTTRSVTPRLHSTWALWGRQFEEHCREIRRRFMPKRGVIALKNVTDEHFESGTPSVEGVFCPDYGILKKKYYVTIRVSFSLLAIKTVGYSQSTPYIWL
jgi:hypothetical protein